ncbi:MAG: hypothetical protein R2764_01360 [Bacteroidales bacterium]
MKTKTKNRYESVLEARGELAGELLDAMMIGQEEYQQEVFDTGVKLLENYFGDAINDRHIKGLYDRLLQNGRKHYWAWYINQRDMWQADFWEEFRLVYRFFLKNDGKEMAAARLKQYWLNDNIDFTDSAVVHSRLREFILTKLK